MTFLSTGLKSLSHFAKCGGLNKFTQSPTRVSYRHMSSANLATAVASILGARCKPEGWGICTSSGPLLPSEEVLRVEARSWFPCKKSEASQRISERQLFFWFFFVFGPATVVEFRVECILEKRFNCETNTKNWGLGCRRTRFPLKWSLVWGLCGLSWKVMQPTLPEMVVYKWMFFSEMIFFQARNRFRSMLVTQKTWCILCKRFDKSSYKGRVQNRL